jgi:hypothetical protein
MHLKREAWILDFDAEADAYARWDTVRDELEREQVSQASKGDM